MQQQYDNTFLARWIADELSEQELKDFKASDDYTYYKQIVDELEHAEFPKYNLNRNFEATLQKIGNSDSNKKTKRLWPIWISTLAASLIVGFGLLFFLKETSYNSQLAQQVDIELPDGSKVQLNAVSTLTHKTFMWNQNRELDLQGEAYFKVKKGDTFSVKTAQGSVTVLGTEFSVNVRENYFNIICYEGKVEVKTKNNTPIILTEGKAVQFKNEILET